ncbi:hypothetical protein GCM10011571_15750 [Marinithermofilum abyssi]|uniref:Uncharacterized protein n=1 Tax=Marinithermofilum abyssi TaxID=1571185 RepID=A0A8J2YAJ8_9BACL|nr:hypothetical protein GCM10011571_15750 [Marinithermofilum abyssi]
MLLLSIVWGKKRMVMREEIGLMVKWRGKDQVKQAEEGER